MENQIDYLESNKIIAEFMGYGRDVTQYVSGKVVGRVYALPRDIFKCTNEAWDEYRRVHSIEAGELPFHEDMAHLLPVVERIGAYMAMWENNHPQVFQQWQDMKVRGLYWTEQDYSFSSNIYFLYPAILKFIAWDAEVSKHTPMTKWIITDIRRV